MSGERGSERPTIGICAAVERVSWGVWDSYEVTLVPRSYVRCVQKAGGIALVLPPDEVAVAEPDVLLDRVDGLMLAGGADIDPASYGAESHPETKGTCPDRDRFELALARRALERDLPVLGICRGMQLLNVALGGTLVQHLPESLGAETHRTVAGTFSKHHIRLDPDSLACTAAGVEGFIVWSHHHQGVDQLGAGLRVSGWSAEDDLPEAVELPGKRFALGVIWHPEEDESSKVIAALVEASRAEKSNPAGRRADKSNPVSQIGPSAAGMRQNGPSGGAA
ncbi:MAG TPA: gamma-glutamyl-gamma-aminobutyrate hydrolase family protein [Solirubrobacterales bacterium]|nr:gamma-glutamyl-gamma-aminobutyrate hydrolase family protein [Solirubrobacterales bacterium]